MHFILRVDTENESEIFEAVPESVVPPVGVGFDICGTDPEPDYLGNTQGKLRCI